jgi:hypothetical protein
MLSPEARQRAIERPKMRMLSAVHEAGHAVAACAYRVKFDGVLLRRVPKLIEEGGFYSGGEVRGLVHPLSGRTRVKVRIFYRRLDDLIAVLLAGRVATEMLFKICEGHEKDYDDIDSVMSVRSPMATPAERDNLIADLRQRVAHLLRKKVIQLITVARHLEQCGELASSEVRKLVYGH